jgi:hypothetical protein
MNDIQFKGCEILLGYLVSNNNNNNNNIHFWDFFGVINGKVILANLFYLMSYCQGYNLLSCKNK